MGNFSVKNKDDLERLVADKPALDKRIKALEKIVKQQGSILRDLLSAGISGLAFSVEDRQKLAAHLRELS